jgi:integrase
MSAISDDVIRAMGFDLTPIPFWKASKAYIEAKIASGRRVNTISNMAFIIGKHLGARWGKRALQSITPADCQEWQNDMVKEHLQMSTLKLRYVIAKGFFNWCLRRRWIVFNPLTAVDAPMLVHTPPRTISPEAVRIVWDHLEDETDKWAFGFLIATGLRKSEWKALDFNDITPEGLMVRERKARDWVCLPINGHLRAHLEAMKAGRSGGPIWTIGPDDYTKRLQEAAMTVEPKVDITLHRLRHTFASFAVAAGTPLIEVRNWLGHRSVSTSEKYARLVLKDYPARYKLLPETIKQWQPIFLPR